MPYTVPWDESSPDGAITPAADIDVEFQDLKTSLRERLEQVIPDFGNDLVDPKVIPSTVIDNSTAFSWAVYSASVSNQIIDWNGTAQQITLGLGISVPGANPWTVDGGNIVFPDDGSYVLISTCSVSLEGAPIQMVVGTKILTLPSGPAQHNDLANFKLDNRDHYTVIDTTGPAISIVKEVSAGDKAQAYATAWNILSNIVGVAKVTGMTVFVLRIGA